MQNLAELLGKFMAGSITEVERKELSLLMELTPDEQLLEELEIAWNNWQHGHTLDEVASQKMLQNILHQKQTTVKKLYTRRWMVAASIIVLLGLAGWWLFYNNKPAIDHPQTAVVTKDLSAPSNTRAVITLADDTKLYLDSAGNGMISQQNNVDVIRNAQGEIVYEAKTREADGDLKFNTLFNPRGSKVIPLTLSDGTKVWLNSESSIKYPVAFYGNERKVEITGEAYFEVAHNAAKPFFVSVNDMQVQVLGTHFNINSYSDEGVIKTTLLEGSVKVSIIASAAKQAPKNGVVIKPGQQAVDKLVTLSSGEGSTLTIRDDVDLDAVVAWKNGLFSFTGTDLKSIMRQVARWYDVEVYYEGNIPERTFTGEIPRSVNLSQLLKLFEASNIRFSIDAANKKLTIHS